MPAPFRCTVVLSVALILGPAAQAEKITVFAAASLKTALDDVAREWTEATGDTAVLSYAGSSALARQIAAGAPADVFISASPAWMDELDRAGLLRPGTRRDLLRNRIVLIAHGADRPPVPIGPGFDLAALVGDERLAMAFVDAVPAGIYGKAALLNLGLWDGIADKVAQTDNVRSALALVAAGEAPYGIVYATDAVAEPRVSIVATFGDETHPPVVYPVALIDDGTSPLGPAFLAFLTGEAASAAFSRQGFGLVE